MKHSIINLVRLKQAWLAVFITGALFAAGATVSGCGASAQEVKPPDTSGKPPGGGDVNDYMKHQAEIKAKLGSGGGGTAPGAGAPGAGAPSGGAPAGGGGSQVPGDNAPMPAKK